MTDPQLPPGHDPHAPQQQGYPYPPHQSDPYAQRTQYGHQEAYPQPPHPQCWPYPTRVQPKNPALHVLVSFFLPGVGSMMAGSAGVGVALLIVWLLSWPLALVFIGFLTAPAAWIAGMVHAYFAATEWNRHRGIES